MRWHDLARLYTPVTATPQSRARPVARVDPEPDSGARWGKPSAFSWSSEAAKTSPAQQSVSNQTATGAPVEYMRIIPAQAQVASQRVKVRSPSDENVWVEIDMRPRISPARPLRNLLPAERPLTAVKVAFGKRSMLELGHQES